MAPSPTKGRPSLARGDDMLAGVKVRSVSMFAIVVAIAFIFMYVCRYYFLHTSIKGGYVGVFMISPLFVLDKRE